MTDLSPPGGQTPTSAPEAERSHIESWDVFLSHNSRDKPVVERIALRLKRAGVEPWLDIWNLTPGGRWQDEIVEGLRATRACAIFIGPHGLGDWVREELAVALDRAAKDRAFRLFLVLLPGVSEPFDPTTLPPFLSTRTWVDMRAGADEPRGIQALINAVRGVAISPLVAVARDDSACPYRGLEVFEREHARYFFGRDADVQRLLEQLRDGRFLAVLGPSGSGKSSLVRAGLLPALADGRLPGSDRWPQRIFKPGARPLVELAAAITTLSPATAGSMQNTLDGLERDHRTLDLAVAFALSGAHADHRVVLLVDQFEEAFTLCRDDDERSAFFANLLYAARTPGGRCVVIVTMRADFYPHTAAWPELAQQVAHSQYLVSPLSSDGLYQAIVEPAHAVGLQFEEGLVETILADVNHQPGALPLLEHALLQLWEQRAGSMLTLEAYRRVGGVSGALARQADAIYAGLTPEQQELARHILLRLTQPGEGT
ncbi:MAG: peptidase C14, partial [Chloroflexi bacterium]